MVRIATQEAQTHLAELVRRASEGETIVITESGHPVAKLIAADETEEQSLTHEQALAKLRGIRSRTSLPAGQELADLIRESRKH